MRAPRFDARLLQVGTAEHIDALRLQGALLADAADEVGLYAHVPTCPDWTVRDLLWHVGTLHRWAKTIVTQRRTSPPADAEVDLIAGPIPDDALLIEWYRESHSQLLRVLETEPADLSCWQLFDAASALEGWARHQAHETTIHRVDAESARGDEISPIDANLASDGINSLLHGFHGSPASNVRSPLPKTLRLHATDELLDGGDWFIHISSQAPITTRTATGPADCTISGPVELLYLALWNRCRTDDLSVSGDNSVVKLWHELSPVEWPLLTRT